MHATAFARATALRCSLGLTLVAILLAATACEERDDDDAMPRDMAPEVAYLNTPENEAMGFPFSEAVRVGHMLYLSGQVGNLPGQPDVVKGGVQADKG